MTTKRLRAKCSKCGRRMFASTRDELLGKIRKHTMRNHKDWFTKRVKAGLKKAKNNPHNPSFSQAILAGIVPAANMPALLEQYKGMSTAERNAVKVGLRLVEGAVPASAPIAEALIRAFDKLA